MTVTVNEQNAGFRDGSTMSYVTVVSPGGNTVGEVAVAVTFTLPELSVIVGSVHDTSAVTFPLSGGTVISPGQFSTTGGVLSRTKMEKISIAISVIIKSFFLP